MIVVRDVFNLKFGKAKDALNIMSRMVGQMNAESNSHYRLLTDLVGNYYTLVLEGTHDSMDSYMKELEHIAEPEWKELYSRFTELVINGYRDIWTVVE
jgi:hypothetical protein